MRPDQSEFKCGHTENQSLESIFEPSSTTITSCSVQLPQPFLQLHCTAPHSSNANIRCFLTLTSSNRIQSFEDTLPTRSRQWEQNQSSRERSPLTLSSLGSWERNYSRQLRDQWCKLRQADASYLSRAGGGGSEAMQAEQLHRVQRQRGRWSSWRLRSSSAMKVLEMDSGSFPWKNFDPNLEIQVKAVLDSLSSQCMILTFFFFFFTNI